jgi:hypothetical protein
MEITPPPTPSPVKGCGGKKRAIANWESDEEDVFVPRYKILVSCIQDILHSDDLLLISPTRDSPKKARAGEPSTPSKVLKSAARQLVFDTAAYVPILISYFNLIS